MGDRGDGGGGAVNLDLNLDLNLDFDSLTYGLQQTLIFFEHELHGFHECLKSSTCWEEAVAR